MAEIKGAIVRHFQSFNVRGQLNSYFLSYFFRFFPVCLG